VLGIGSFLEFEGTHAAVRGFSVTMNLIQRQTIYC